MMPTLTPTAELLTAVELLTDCDAFCDVCHCQGEGCDGVVCHGLDAD